MKGVPVDIGKATYLTGSLALQGGPDSFSEILAGCEAIARGALEANVTFATGYPGEPATGVASALEAAAQAHPELGLHFEWSLNEGVAFEKAFAASWTGMRSVVVMKHVGLNVAMDAFQTMSEKECGAGLLLVIGADPGPDSSQNSQDERSIISDLGLLGIEPSDQQECLDFARLALSLSEKHHLPIVLRVNPLVAESLGPVRIGPLDRRPVQRHFRVSRRLEFVTSVPTYAADVRKRRDLISLLQPEVSSLFCRQYGRLEPHAQRPSARAAGPLHGGQVKGIIYSGLLAGPVEEALDELRLQDQPRLRLSAFSPLAEATLVQFLQSVSDVLILEEQMPFLESQIAALALRKGIHVRVLGKMEGAYTPFKTGVITKDLAKRALQRFVREPSGEQADAVPAAPMPASPGPHADLAIPRALLYCPGCPHAAAHFALNFAFDAGLQVWRQREPMIRSSDIGCYGSLPSFLAEAELKFHMGGGFGLAGGLARCPLFTPLGGETVSHPLVVAFAGDSTFFHSAVIRLLDAAANRAPCLYVVFDNKTVALTGLQPVPALPMAALAETMGVASRVVNVFDVWGASRAFGDSIDFVTNEKKPALIVAEGECALLPHAPQLTSRKYRVAEDKCDNCGLCVEGFHCPALVRGPASLLSQPHAAQQHPFPSSTQAANPPKPSILPDICVGCGVCEIVCRYSLTVQHTARQVGAIESVPPSSATAHPSPPLPQPALQSYLAPCRLPAATCNLPFNLVLAGVGGLGLPDLAELIVRAAHLAGHKAVRAFVKGGISERFGAVYAMIRIGPAARTSSLSPGEADVVLAMEPLEALRACCGDGRMPAFASPSCTSVALSMLPFPPLAVTLGQRAYPSWENLLGALEETCASVHPVSPHPDFLTRPLAHNLYLLGAACHLFEHVLSPEALRQAVAELAPNALAAFDAGRADHRPPPARS